MIEKVLNNRMATIYIAPFVLGILTVFSFQPFNFTFINFLIMPIIFLLINYVNKRSKNIYRKKPYLKNLFLLGYSFGVGFFFSGIYWVSYSLTFFDEFKYLIPFAVILLPLFLGLFYGLVPLISGPYLKHNFVSILFFSLTFAASDYIRSMIFGGFPWNLWAYSWSWFEEVIQILNPIGLFAFNLIVITIFSTPALLIIKKYKYKYLLFFSMFFLIFSSYIYGSLKINQNDVILKKAQINNELINIKIISPNFDLKYNLSSADIEELLKKLIKFSDPKKNQETIFVWPEGVFVGYNFSELEKYQSLFENNFDKNHTIIFGISTSDSSKSVFNSMLAVNNKLQIINQYNKKKLVPFGEFLPFESILNKFGLKKITYGYGSFSKGLNQKNFIINNLNILPLICYEIIFPELTQNSDNNTNIIINISEDAWFGGSIGPHQHFAKAVFRSIENNTIIARSANKGISAFISNTGTVIKSLEINEAGNIEMKIPMLVNDSRNKNDLIFFILLFTYILILLIFKKNNYEK